MKGEFLLRELFQSYPDLNICKDQIVSACDTVIHCYQQGGKLLVCGNGGSCSDSDHIVGELMKSFEASRPLKNELVKKLPLISPERGALLAFKLESGLPAISLNAHGALFSAISNDIGADFVFAQQVAGYGEKGDVLIAISSSGNSQNVVDAAITAKALGLKVIGLTGKTGGKMNQFCDVLIGVPSEITSKIQEYHLPIYHTTCKVVEQKIFGNHDKL